LIMGSDSVSPRGSQSAAAAEGVIIGAPTHPTVKKESDDEAPLCIRMACLCRSMDASICRRASVCPGAGWTTGAAGFCAQIIPVQTANPTDKRDRPRNRLAEVDFMEVNRVNTTTVPPQTVAETKIPVAPELTQAVKAVNSAKLFGQDTELSFLMDRESKHFIVRLVEKDTHKVIRQIPAEQVLRWAEALG
jgi:uncharacterized FlaG/YvyC family protein